MSINVTSGDAVNVSVKSSKQDSVALVASSTTKVSVVGLAGGAGDAHFVYTQSTPEAIWEITHNLGKKPSVTVVDSGDSVVVGEVEYINLNSVRLTFAGAFSGKAYFN